MREETIPRVERCVVCVWICMNMCECGECLATGRTDEGTGTKKDPEDYSVILNGERGCHWPHDLCVFELINFPVNKQCGREFGV